MNLFLRLLSRLLPFPPLDFEHEPRAETFRAPALPRKTWDPALNADGMRDLMISALRPGPLTVMGIVKAIALPVAGESWGAVDRALLDLLADRRVRSITGEPFERFALLQADMAWIDLETSGLDPRAHEILEVALIRRDALTGEEIARYHARVLPTRPVSQDAAAINGYDPVLWAKDGKPLRQVLRELAPLLAGAMLAGKNPSFDRGFLEEAARQTGIPVLRALGSYRMIDVGSLALPLLLAGKVESLSLDALCVFYGIKGDAHRAMGDVRRTFAVYERLIPVPFVAPPLEDDGPPAAIDPRFADPAFRAAFNALRPTDAIVAAVVAEQEPCDICGSAPGDLHNHFIHAQQPEDPEDNGEPFGTEKR